MRTHLHVARPAALALLATLAACGGAKPRPVPVNVPVLPPIVTFRSATLGAAGFEGVTVDVALDVENPNPFALPVVRVAHALTVDGVPAFSGQSPATAAVASRGTYPVIVPVYLPYGRIPDIGAKVAAGQPLAYRATGSVGFQTPAGIMDLPIAWEGTMPVPRPPQFSFEGIDVGGLGALALKFDVKMRVVNPNAFPLPPGRLGHRLAVADAPVASGDQKVPPVGAGGTATFAIPAQVNIVGAGAGVVKGVWTALQGAEVPVAMEGQATIAGIPIDVRLESRIPRVK
jgi:LEA14-like dessication related protein